MDRKKRKMNDGSVLSLPDDLCVSVINYLDGKSIFGLLQAHSKFYILSSSKSFWHSLLQRDGYSHNTALPIRESVSTSDLRFQFQTNCHAASFQAIEWCPLRRLPPSRQEQLILQTGYPTTSPEPREGHLMCALKCGTANQQQQPTSTVLLTGGFCDDAKIHFFHTDAHADNPIPSSTPEPGWRCVEPTYMSPDPSARPCFVYGATLTPLDATRAIRFGGFRAGGYNAETNTLALLTFQKEEAATQSQTEQNPNAGDDAHNYTATWQIVTAHNADAVQGRAYHTATLFHDRYLLILGGMTSNASLFDTGAILDTHTWTWRTDLLPQPCTSFLPPPRHGHSAVLDEHRNRVVLFGGGNGDDLLRSGIDNTEVWELQLGPNWDTDFENSFPWCWNQIYKDVDDNDDAEATILTTSATNTTTKLPSRPKSLQLSPAETLCFGRCHVGVRVTRDLAVLCFGSGHPTTNGILGYDLASDRLLRLPPPSRPLFLPAPRFSTAAALLPHQHRLLVHGGYSAQDGGILGDTVLLDLAPQMKRTFAGLDVVTRHTAANTSTTAQETSSPQQLLPHNYAATPSYRPVLDSDVQSRLDQQSQHETFSTITNWMNRLAAAPDTAQRQIMAEQFLQEADAMARVNDNDSADNRNFSLDDRGGRSLMLLLRMIGDGRATFGTEEIEIANQEIEEEEEEGEEEEKEIEEGEGEEAWVEEGEEEYDLQDNDNRDDDKFVYDEYDIEEYGEEGEPSDADGS